MKQEKFLLIASALWILLLFSLGAWWSYLILLYGEKISNTFGENFLSMIKWEGGTFLFVLLLLSITILVLYLADKKRTRALGAFFASLTHELKTPLASIRLQAEVLDAKLHYKENQELSNRMIEDVERLENQMDKILELARLERGTHLSLFKTDLEIFLKNFIKRQSTQHKKSPNIDLKISEHHPIMANEFALELILKNLIENSKNHGENHDENNSESKKITIVVKDTGIYYTNHSPFKGDPKKAGNLFYKSHASKGSGIGLYIVKSLIKKMKGRVYFKFHHEFTIILHFKKAI